MSELQPINGTQSPFDSIRRVSPEGREYWLARELHPLVGYERWERFVMAVERAKAAADNCGEPVQDHFRPSSKKVDLGSGAERWVADFELTRYGAYLSVMNGDPRKPEIAAAQSYFAIRTREAEVSTIDTRQQAELVTKADLARMVLEIEEEKAVLAAALESAAPMIAYHDRYISNDDAVLVEVWGTQFGLTRPRAFQALVDHKLIYRRLIMRRYSKTHGKVIDEHEYRPFARYIDWFDLRPQHDAPRHHNGQVRQTLYVRQQFALAIADKLGLQVNA